MPCCPGMSVLISSNYMSFFALLPNNIRQRATYVAKPQNEVNPFFPPKSRKNGSRKRIHRPAVKPAPVKSSTEGKYWSDAIATNDPTANPASIWSVYMKPVGSSISIHINATVVGAWTGFSGISDFSLIAPPMAERKVHAKTVKTDGKTSNRCDQSSPASPYNDHETAPEGMVNTTLVIFIDKKAHVPSRPPQPTSILK
mmetsp:Transcript_15924/g.34597  ORF Transcript_15924/g.34597 Transcript_15924/m.34597 type:complete len:199 (+) Transcript_15924:98-694(+)